jgi:ABC-2 type transport system permease protein
LSLPVKTAPSYDSIRRPAPPVEELIELIRYRYLLVELVSRNIKARYKRSILGVGWTMLNPLLMMTVISLVFTDLFKTSLSHYSVYLLAGLTFWTFFSQTTSTAMSELVWGGALLRRIYMPRSIFAVSALGTGLVNLVLALVPLVAIALVTGAAITPALLFLPVPILLTSMFALGVGLLISTLAVYFADVIEMYQVVLLAGMYLTPVMYPLDIIPESNRWMYNFNPMHHLLYIFRVPVYEGRLPELASVGTAAAFAVPVLIAGWWFFARRADEFAYRL